MSPRLATLRRDVSLLFGGTPATGQVRIFYGYRRVPGPDDEAAGGMVKYQQLQRAFPNAPRRFNLLYLVSSATPPGLRQLMWVTRRKNARLVWNQNGVAYPAWHGPGWERVNERMAPWLHAADHVFYQSRFCKLGADRYLGPRHGPLEIVHNAVDTNHFTPASSDPDPQRLVLLLAGNQYQAYRLETALRVLAHVARHTARRVRLLVTGRLSWIPDARQAARDVHRLAEALGVADVVEFIGPYTQREAPSVYRRAHVLLHTKYNDPCPGVVIEAMACGLPVVYSASGGVPELVGPEAGIGMPAPLEWERDIPPDPEAMAQAVLQVAERRAAFAEAARRRAVEHFDVAPWLARHRQVFEELVR